MTSRRSKRFLHGMQLTIDVPQELADRLLPERDRLAEIIERGLRRAWSDQVGIGHEVIAFLAGGPAPREIIAYRPPSARLERARELLARNRSGSLTVAEAAELDEYEAVDSFVTLVKAEAHRHSEASGA